MFFLYLSIIYEKKLFTFLFIYSNDFIINKKVNKYTFKEVCLNNIVFIQMFICIYLKEKMILVLIVLL